MSLIATLVLLKTLTGTSFVKLPTLDDQRAGVEIFDRDNHSLCTVQRSELRQPVPLELMSRHIRSAILASEDRNFYNHPGIDPVSIVRALLSNLRAGRVVQGGSTITQQLVKILYLDPQDRTLERKLREALMSLDVDSGYSKNKILETYLNSVYFGNGAYGVQRAAEAYFNKSAAQLNLAEAAFLAGVVRAPSELSAPDNRSKAMERQRQILDRMVECRFITKTECEAAKQEKLTFHNVPYPLKHPYYVNYVLGLVEEQIGKTHMWEKPLRVYTNLDRSAQAIAESTLLTELKAAPPGIEQGALVSMSISDGAVIALVGGVGDYGSHQFNRATHPHTLGSAFKPFVYLAGLTTGAIGPASVLNDEPITVQDTTNGSLYSPRDFDGRYLGPLTVRDALALSRNVCAVVVGQQAGITNVIATARAAGISADMDPYPSLALGTCAASPLEMATAYATLARSGVYLAPQFIRHIDAQDGTVLKEFGQTPARVLPAEPVNELVDALQDVVTRGTGKAASLPGIAVAGKTGTADQSRDVWFIGFTPDVVTAVWGGNDEDLPVPGDHVTGGSVMAGIWRDYMRQFYETHTQPVTAFASPTVPLARQLPLAALAGQDVGQVVDTVDQAAGKAIHGLWRGPRSLWHRILSGLRGLF